MTRLWCRIHGRADHLHIEVCGACGRAYDSSGRRSCQAVCNGPTYKRYAPADQQQTWRCVE